MTKISSQIINKCYITYDMDFRQFLMTTCALKSCDVVISKQGDGSGRGRRSNRCVTGRRPHDNYAVRFRQSAENRESSQGTCSQSEG